MNTIPACPPIPTLNELTNRNKYIRIDPTDVVLNEFLIMRHLGDIRCIQIVDVFTDYATRVTSQFTYSENGNGPTIGVRVDQFNNEQGELYRKSPRKDFDDVTTETEERIRNYPINQQLTSAETIFANKGLSDNIGKFLGPPTSGKGGRRKRRGTRRTRKNKRKSTRRVRRKYKR